MMSVSEEIKRVHEALAKAESLDDITNILHAERHRIRGANIDSKIKLDVSEEAKDFKVRTQQWNPPHTEIEGDVFDRQRVMVDWDQSLIENQTVFCVGTGGLGQSVQMACVRLGVKKMYILDMDTYDYSNANRQILGNLSDHGKRKVDVAERGLALHNIRTEIIKLHQNAVTGWGKIVETARDSTVIFNTIDYGACMDFALNSLSKSLQIPYVSGSTYASTMICDFSSGASGACCWACNNNIMESFTDNEMSASDLEKYLEEKKVSELDGEGTLAYLTSRSKMSGSLAAEMINQAMNSNQISAINSENLLAFLKQLKNILEDYLLPSKIQSYQDISFIPNDRHFPTRNVGSWVCVCSGGALLMVNCWAQHMMGHQPANWNTIGLQEMTADSSRIMDKETWTRKDGASDSACKVCGDQQK